MKKSELDLSKAHVDKFGTTGKAYDGLKLTYTKAGWATVTADGTIVEVLDSFSGDLHAAQFEARDELEAGSVIDESILLNPKDIGSAGVDDDAEIFDSVVNAAVAAIANLTNIANITGITNNDTAAVTAGMDVDGASDVRADVDFGITVTASDGYTPYTYAWTVEGSAVGNTTPVAIPGETTNTLTLSLADLDALLAGQPSVNAEIVTVTCTVTDDKSPTPETANATVAFTITDV